MFCLYTYTFHCKLLLHSSKECRRLYPSEKPRLLYKSFWIYLYTLCIVFVFPCYTHCFQELKVFNSTIVFIIIYICCVSLLKMDKYEIFKVPIARHMEKKIPNHNVLTFTFESLIVNIVEDSKIASEYSTKAKDLYKLSPAKISFT